MQEEHTYSLPYSPNKPTCAEERFLDAARSGNERVIQKMMPKMFTFNIQDSKKHSPLWLAACNGHVEIVRDMLICGSKATNKYGNLEEDIDVNFATTYGSTPLHAATYNGHRHVVRLLLSHPDIDMNIVNRRGFSCVHYAVWRNRIEILQMLLCSGADIDRSLPDDDYTALERSLTHPWGPARSEMVCLLVYYGAKSGTYMKHDPDYQVSLTVKETINPYMQQLQLEIIRNIPCGMIPPLVKIIISNLSVLDCIRGILKQMGNQKRTAAFRQMFKRLWNALVPLFLVPGMVVMFMHLLSCIK